MELKLEVGLEVGLSLEAVISGLDAVILKLVTGVEPELEDERLADHGRLGLMAELEPVLELDIMGLELASFVGFMLDSRTISEVGRLEL